MDTVYEQVKENRNHVQIYTYGPIIHNEEVVKDLEQKGVDRPSQRRGAGYTGKEELLLSALTGWQKMFMTDLERKKIHIVDATCPFVKKIHKIVQKAQ